MKHLLEIENLSVSFDTSQGKLQAVRNVSFTLEEGQVLAIIGESGCGKSVLCRSIMKLLPPSARIHSGKILVKGRDITGCGEQEMKRLRGRLFSMVFQDPMTALNPVMPIGRQIGEAVRIHNPKMDRTAVRERVLELMELVGLPLEYFNSYPFELDPGRLQRAGIARAISLHPEFLVCDEPVSALDVSVHAQILELLMDLQEKLGITYLFISHNLAVVKDICPSVAVMFLGHIMETGDTKTIFNNPLHPYTQSLLSAVLDLDVDSTKKRIILKGEVPSPIDVPSGCPFCTRCPKAGERCRQERPKSVLAEPGHFVACHQPGPL